MNSSIKSLSVLFVICLFTVATLTAKEVKVNEGFVTWEGKKLAYGHIGTVKIKSGQVNVDAAGNPANGSFIIDMTKIKNSDLSNSPDKAAYLEKHLKSEDFFAVDKYPVSSFVFSNVQILKADPKGYTHSLKGKLAIRGIEKDHSIKIKWKNDKSKYKMSSEFDFNRLIFGVNFDSSILQKAADKIINDLISIRFDLVLE